MADRLKGKTALIIGAATGIGEAVTRAFAAEGATLVVSYHKASPDAMVAEINASGGQASTVRLDVGDETSVKNAVATVVERHGRLDVAFNNAGILAPIKPLADITAKEFDDTIRVDLRGTFLAMKYEINQMLKNGGGSIINTGSVGSVIANAGLTPYIASKHGVLGLTRSAAIEYAQQGIRVNVLAPGFVETRMTAEWLVDPDLRAVMTAQNSFNRASQPDEIAGMVVYLASDEASFTTGGIFLVDGAQTAI
ncbi:MAG: SDR family oxidoreductase [Bifidobacteriaceae bacterium]|jgi:NAD(P)-dependent dehydrogenase (short-subunit alcohol dehydrogenase family)|nr:SDR family oxidoreductase [Bifidobacteriaceae bacterium]